MGVDVSFLRLQKIKNHMDIQQKVNYNRYNNTEVIR